MGPPRSGVGVEAPRAWLGSSQIKLPKVTLLME